MASNVNAHVWSVICTKVNLYIQTFHPSVSVARQDLYDFFMDLQNLQIIWGFGVRQGFGPTNQDLIYITATFKGDAKVYDKRVNCSSAPVTIHSSTVSRIPVDIEDDIVEDDDLNDAYDRAMRGI